MIDIIALRNDIRNGTILEDPFSLISAISKLCAGNIEIGRELVIRTLEYRSRLSEEYRHILDEIVMSVGLYPYVDELSDLSLKSAMLHAANRADGEMTEYVLHSAQSRILRKLIAGQSIILSAPTSFGKSLLIDLLISAKDFSNIILIVPTLALVEETRRRMARFVERYSIITSGNQDCSERNIFVLTQERYLAMRDGMPTPDFFVIDEFYKLSICEEGDRATLLNQAFLALVQTDAQFYLLGPAIKAIPENIQKIADCSFIIENFQTVAVEQVRIKSKAKKIDSLVDLLSDINGQTLIYCQSPGSTRKTLAEYIDRASLRITTDQELLEAAAWTATNFHDKWLVSIGLKYGIGIHHGRLPRALGRFMVRAFEEKKLHILLCTSTLIEGVNTTAKNVIIFDNKLNRKPLEFFTYNNIRGRSGRAFQHFVGNVFVFDEPPEEELPFVDFPALNPTEKTPSSLLIQMPIASLPPIVFPRVQALLSQDYISLQILKTHPGIEPEFIVSTAKYLSELPIQELQDCIWTGSPRYENLGFISELIWNQLGGASIAKRAGLRSAKMMTFWIWDLYKKRSVPAFRKAMIANQVQNGTSPDEAVETVLAFIRSWASFNYPKYLSALNDICSHVLNSRGLHSCNYIPFAAAIESLFQPSSYSSLEEYGLPTEITERLASNKVFMPSDSLDTIVKRLRSPLLGNYARNLFERRIIEDFQGGIGNSNQPFEE